MKRPRRVFLVGFSEFQTGCHMMLLLFGNGPYGIVTTYRHHLLHHLLQTTTIVPLQRLLVSSTPIAFLTHSDLLLLLVTMTDAVPAILLVLLTILCKLGQNTIWQANYCILTRAIQSRQWVSSWSVDAVLICWSTFALPFSATCLATSMHFTWNTSTSTDGRKVSAGLSRSVYKFCWFYLPGRLGQLSSEPAPGVYSDNIQTGGTRGYGTVWENRQTGGWIVADQIWCEADFPLQSSAFYFRAEEFGCLKALSLF